MTVERDYFRVPCEFQLRYRKIDENELEHFRSALRPSPYSTFRMNLENQLASMGIQEESKVLLEKAFQLLINMDQRLERLEEQIQGLKIKDDMNTQQYEWRAGDLGAGGISFDDQDHADMKQGDAVVLDVILPSMPEYRFVSAARVSHVNSDGLGFEFIEIHSDDQEYIHRFVRSREREILRTRAKERDKI